MRGELFVAATTLVLAAGCIQRYAAPTERPTPDAPYAAIAAWHGVTLDEGRGAPAPEAALRVVGSPVWYADAVLLDEVTTADGEDSVAALIRERDAPVVLLATDEAACIPAAWNRVEVHRAVLQDDTVVVIPLTTPCTVPEPPDGD